MTVKLLPVAVLAFALSGCSSERPDRPGLAIVQSVLKRGQAVPVVSDQQQVEAAVQASLAALDMPLALATFEKTQNNVVLRQIAENGPYRSWSDAASAERRTISTRNGVLTSTRGLTNDLMSSDVTETLSLVSSRTSGTATRVQRYLTSENKTYELSANCSISRGDNVRVTVGEIDQSAVEMTETCSTDTRDFTNIYRVSASGRVLQSVQWLNEFYGVVVVQQLR